MIFPWPGENRTAQGSHIQNVTIIPLSPLEVKVAPRTAPSAFLQLTHSFFFTAAGFFKVMVHPIANWNPPFGFEVMNCSICSRDTSRTF